jgi:ABC-type molybdate transport system substrate-binding protein
VRAAGDKATGVEIAERNNLVAEYPIAIVKATRNRSAARRFIDLVTKGTGRAALDRAGFLTAP